MKTLNIPKSIKDMEQKTPGPRDLTSECYEIRKGEISPSSYKFCQKGEEGKHFSNHFMRPVLQNTKTR